MADENTLEPGEASCYVDAVLLPSYGLKLTDVCIIIKSQALTSRQIFYVLVISISIELYYITLDLYI